MTQDRSHHEEFHGPNYETMRDKEEREQVQEHKRHNFYLKALNNKANKEKVATQVA